jgi:hypothetical protein
MRSSARTYLRSARSSRPCSSAPWRSFSIFGALTKTTRRFAWQARYASERARKVLPVPGRPMKSGFTLF